MRYSARPLNAGLEEKPLGGLVICGSGPNLIIEFVNSDNITGFPDPDFFDRFAYSADRFLTPRHPKILCLADLVDHAFADIVGDLYRSRLDQIIDLNHSLTKVRG